ncbi:MAG: alaS [Nocardioidaceae bacterium]|nr:alaS [Nocardioidaceae bacterium]
MQTAEIRRRFLSHFEQRGHHVVASSSLLYDDPNLLFVNAGMVPFKPYFLGQETPPWPRAASVQKCVRTQDIEEVGRTTRHGTFFEMCGNFSFGDYFKERAIQLGWELVTRSQADGGFGFAESQLYASVYHDDDEAIALWKQVAGLPDDRIVRLGMKDNYWSMGVPGPCGPCSEILIDRGPEFGAERDWEAGDRYMEFWNLVFMQNLRGPGGVKEDYPILGELPAKNIDTGMGLERVAYLLQGVDNMYEIDEIRPVITVAEELSGRRYGGTGPGAHDDDVRMRVVADHVRSGLMLISDGVAPGNEGRGYVLRRLLRRAVRSMRLLGVDEPALPALLPVASQWLSPSYPQLEQDFARIARIAYAEEEAFRQTLRAGTQIFDTAVSRSQTRGERRLSGAAAFQLHDTYGFPIDLTLEMAGEQGLEVDEPGFRALMDQQRERAKADSRAKKGQHADTTAYREAVDLHGSTESLAYETLTSDAGVRAVLRAGGDGLSPVPQAVAGELVELVLDRTPFYAESGGQAADIGTLTWDGGRGEVVDVQRPVGGLVVHQVRVAEGSLQPGDRLLATVDEQWRLGACQAHSGTHVVHAALREILGPTALQSGSYNRPGYLRLDFGWNDQVGAAQVAELEQASNEALRSDLEVSAQELPLEQARAAGALALFGERYPEIVRMVEIGGPWSRELCGGTHVERSSQIGTVVLMPISSIGAGNRRVEAYVGLEGFRHLTRERDLVNRLTELLKTPHDDIVGRVQDMVERLRNAERQLEAVRVQQLLSSAAELAGGARTIGDVQVVTTRVPEGAGAAQVRTLALDVRGRLASERPAVVAVAGSAGGKPAVVVTVNDAARDRGLSASALVKIAAGTLGGSGGGRDDVAQGGGATLSGDGADARLDAALAEVERAVEHDSAQPAGGI